MSDSVLETIAYEEVGSAGSPILWLHGLDGPGPDAPVVERLAADHRVLVPTFPGFGEAPRPDRIDSVSDIAHLCLELLEEKGLDNVTVIGCSLGGWVAAEMAVWRPTRIGRLVLVDAVGIRVGGITDRDIQDLFVISAEERRALLFHAPEKGGPLPSELDDDTLLPRLRAEEMVALYAWEPYLCNPKLLSRLRYVDLPACVVWGADDRLVAPQYGRAFAEALSASDFHLIENAGHNAHIEQTDTFVDVVGRFIARSPASAPTS